MGLTIASVKYGKELDSLDVFYGGFYFLREQLALRTGYEYRRGPGLFDLTLHWEKENEKDFLTRFYLHSDCDGKIMQSDLKHLYEEFKDIKFEKGPDELNFKRAYDSFMPFLKETVDQKAHWEFY